jgi:hypothetical protein
MSTFQYKVSIDADSDAQAKEVLQGMFDIMKTVRKRTSTKDFIVFATALKNNPSLVDKAKFFM